MRYAGNVEEKANIAGAREKTDEDKENDDVDRRGPSPCWRVSAGRGAKKVQRRQPRPGLRMPPSGAARCCGCLRKMVFCVAQRVSLGDQRRNGRHGSRALFQSAGRGLA